MEFKMGSKCKLGASQQIDFMMIWKSEGTYSASN